MGGPDVDKMVACGCKQAVVLGWLKLTDELTWIDGTVFWLFYLPTLSHI